MLSTKQSAKFVLLKPKIVIFDVAASERTQFSLLSIPIKISKLNFFVSKERFVKIAE